MIGSVITSEMQTNIYDASGVGSLPRQQANWWTRHTAPRGLIGSRSARQKIQPDAVQDVAKGNRRR
jgi:hypothetical protein